VTSEVVEITHEISAESFAEFQALIASFDAGQDGIPAIDLQAIYEVLIEAYLETHGGTDNEPKNIRTDDRPVAVNWQHGTADR
jgi:hypothetical protein